jgi:pyrroline-5-carboxylate reductase
VIDPGPEVLKTMKQEGMDAVASVPEALKRSPAPKLIVMAVKPGVFLKPESGLPVSLSKVPEETLAVSLMAGVPLERLRQQVPGVRWVRSMTNLALSTGKGMTVLAASSQVTHAEQCFLYSLFSAMGRALWIPEESFDAATAIAGSGPGLLALVAEALSDGGVREGLSRETATLLSSWAVFGTGSLLCERSVLPEALKSKVASPAGTTIEGLAILEKQGVRGAMIEAVRCMTQRSRNLSQQV